MAAFEPAFSAFTAIEPPTIVTGSLNVELLTSTAPVPADASPIVIELNPSARRVNSVSSRLSVPAPPPRPMVVVVVRGLIVREPLESIVPRPVPLTFRSSVFALSVMSPVADPPPIVFSEPMNRMSGPPAPVPAVAVTVIAPLSVESRPPVPPPPFRFTPELPLLVAVPVTVNAPFWT